VTDAASRPTSADTGPAVSDPAATDRLETEPPRRADVVVIGAGSGGLTAAVGLARFGRSVVLVERDRFGGDCTNVGCIPSKSLLHLTAAAVPLDPPSLLARVRFRRDQLRESETVEFGATPNLETIFGAARIVGPGDVRIQRPDGVEEILCEHIVIATGSRPRRLDLGIEPDRVITNMELFELAERPDRLAVVGAGPVGLEAALAFARMGSLVTVIEQADQILPGVLPDAAGVLQRSLEAHGVRVMLGTPASGELEPISTADTVLVAVGRVPNSDGLGLEEIGVDLDGTGRIRIDARGETSVEQIWATGDVADRTGTTHGAGAWGRRIVKSIVARPVPIGAEPLEPRVVFTDPEVATIGEQPARVPGDVRRTRFELADSDRGFTDEITGGLIIVDTRRLTGRVLGATIVGPRAGELISLFSLGMHAGIPFHKWFGTVWPYPTYADALGRLLDDYMREVFGSVPSDAARWFTGRLRSLTRRR
jgi:pyruvate/2-oxoglutarate dehydrogenase complex dihydrolipoamide dehydrogenase (E3) component